jgi:arylformamidase
MPDPAGQLIDISLPLSPTLATWPDSPGVEVTWRMLLDNGDDANVTQLSMDVHTGTHVDAPRHHLPDGATIDQIDPAAVVGAAHVIDLRAHAVIDAAALDRSGIPAHVERLLLKTRNSDVPDLAQRPFDPAYTAITADAAQWIVDHAIRSVGIDYLSIQCYDDPPDTHRILLRAGIAIIEGLCLQAVAPGPYYLVCLPIYLVGIEAAPARAILFAGEGPS